MKNSALNSWRVSGGLRTAAILLPMMLLAMCAGTAPTPSAAGKEASAVEAGPSQIAVGIASWYGKEHHGKTTANGEIFDMNKLTAAHRSLRFGTTIRVTNLSNGQSVEVRVNDRGPFVAGRIIDLSMEAARRLGMVTAGLAKVKLEILEPAKGK